jgi:hypothetical protein
MSLALATHGYLIDQVVVAPPAQPPPGQGHLDPNPHSPHGHATVVTLPPVDPLAGG